VSEASTQPTGVVGVQGLRKSLLEQSSMGSL
jgi:hypothetical protein